MAQLVGAQARLQVAEPSRRAHPEAASIVPEEPVARNESPGAREPHHGLPRAPDGHRLDALGKRRLGAGSRRVEAPHDLVPAAAVEADRRQDANRPAVGSHPFLERGPELVGDERVDEDERVGSLVRDRPDALGPVGGTVGRSTRCPLRMWRFPAPEPRRELREPRYCWSSGGFWTLCSVAYSSTSLLITSAPSP